MTPVDLAENLVALEVLLDKRHLCQPLQDGIYFLKRSTTLDESQGQKRGNKQVSLQQPLGGEIKCEGDLFPGLLDLLTKGEQHVCRSLRESQTCLAVALYHVNLALDRVNNDGPESGIT